MSDIRHTVEDRLTRYTRAMDDQNAEAAATLLADSELHFKMNRPLQGRSEIAAFFAAAFPNPSRTRHLISNLTLDQAAEGVEYRAIYQRWSVIDPAIPVCEAFGHYSGRFTVASGTVVWTEHRVIAT